MTIPATDQKTREVMWDMSTGATAVFFVLAALSIIVFAYGVVAPIRRYWRGSRVGLPPLKELPRRFGKAAKLIVTHETIARRNRVVGMAHRLIVYGWLTLFAGTVIVALDHDILRPLFGISIFKGNFYLLCKALLNLLGTGLVAGMVVMMWRRAVTKPPALDYTFESLAKRNIDAIRSASFSRIVTTDPHSLNALRNEYQFLSGESWEVVHHAQLLLELVEAGQLPTAQLDYRVTYHDPCHLGRVNGDYEAPRALMREIGCTLVEMGRNRANSFYCGAGGGQIWLPDPLGIERPSENRIHEATALDDVDYFVVTCPKDVTMYEEAIRSTGNEGNLTLRELTELLEEAHAMAGRTAVAT